MLRFFSGVIYIKCELVNKKLLLPVNLKCHRNVMYIEFEIHGKSKYNFTRSLGFVDGIEICGNC